MEDTKIMNYIKDVLAHMPTDWLGLTTHRLDIYNESKAKSEFLNEFESLVNSNNSNPAALKELPTAYDYIRLGHPLSCILEWTLAQKNGLNANQVISFSSKTVPVLAVLRTNLLKDKSTRICYSGELPAFFDVALIKKVYGYSFELSEVEHADEVSEFSGSNIFISETTEWGAVTLNTNIDFHINMYGDLGSVLFINGEKNQDYVSDIQHVRRRETVAMTPADTLTALEKLAGAAVTQLGNGNYKEHKAQVLKTIGEITEAGTKALVASSGLSTQYAIMMGLVDHAQENHPGKPIKFVVPPNCYGGTNDQARRVAACLPHVEIVDLPVDGENDMVQSVNTVLAKLAIENAVPYIIAEIPTNPRVEVPELIELQKALSKIRKTTSGENAVDPVFILDQTFCPNVHFLGDGEILSGVRTISYVSGSKFPSGGRCNAGYCAGNAGTKELIEKIEHHLHLCDNEATALQYEILAEQMPSMNQRIHDAYLNTREFVNYLEEALPEAKINFVSEELAEQGFTPSVFSLDLPTKGATEEEKELYKRELNHKLIDLMITRIPNESKHCVSYGQLKGCYWTIPATSTQGTTKEGDKDYIARVALSANMDLELHKQVFSEFVEMIG